MRVDLYNIAGRILFGEMTPYPGGVSTRFLPESLDLCSWSEVESQADGLGRQKSVPPSMHMKNGTEQAGLRSWSGRCIQTTPDQNRPLTFDVLRLSDT